jgi:hypothetical protein
VGFLVGVKTDNYLYNTNMAEEEGSVTPDSVAKIIKETKKGKKAYEEGDVTRAAKHFKRASEIGKRMIKKPSEDDQ